MVSKCVPTDEILARFKASNQNRIKSLISKYVKKGSEKKGKKRKIGKEISNEQWNEFSSFIVEVIIFFLFLAINFFPALTLCFFLIFVLCRSRFNLHENILTCMIGCRSERQAKQEKIESYFMNINTFYARFIDLPAIYLIRLCIQSLNRMHTEANRFSFHFYFLFLFFFNFFERQFSKMVSNVK